MQRIMLKSKIHRATVTDANLAYEGSITIDANLLELADIIPYERVEIYDCNNGNRFATYVIEGERDSGVICLNGAAARMVAKGDVIIIACYANLDAEEALKHKAQCVFVDGNNRPANITH